MKIKSILLVASIVLGSSSLSANAQSREAVMAMPAFNEKQKAEQGIIIDWLIKNHQQRGITISDVQTLPKDKPGKWVLDDGEILHELAVSISGVKYIGLVLD